MTITIEPTQAGNLRDEGYDAFRARMNARFTAAAESGPLFLTDAAGLWETYLASFPLEHRQYHNCHACRTFIERFGALATIDETGQLRSAVWDEEDAPEDHVAAVAALARLVRRSKVLHPFVAAETTWGSPATGLWTHFYLKPPVSIRHKHSVMTAGQFMAEKREAYGIVSRALADFPPDLVLTAVMMLRADALYRSEKVLGQAEWLSQLHAARAGVSGELRKNVVWRAVAAAPTGFCHPRSSMIGTLLEDLAAGLPADDVAARFKAKMHPLSYQRPQAPPSTGAIEAAEKLVQQLGLERSLARRFALEAEIPALWRPVPQPAAAGGIFAHLAPGNQRKEDVLGKAPPMSWLKFQREVLPFAQRIDIHVPGRGPFCVFVTATDPMAPPLLQWDRPEARNPVSWYFYNGGSYASDFGLAGEAFASVRAVALQPSMWGEKPIEHQGSGVMFVIADATDRRNTGGLALFPECLRSELHGVRSVIEGYSKSRKLDPTQEQHAAGLMFKDGQHAWTAALRVKTDGGTMIYMLDRWE